MKKQDDYEQEVALVSVKDAGLGIDPEILPRLFEKFASIGDDTNNVYYHATGFLEWALKDLR